jgi:hypothetical protein
MSVEKASEFRKLISIRAGPNAAQSKGTYCLQPLNTGIAGSNPPQGMDVRPRFSMLCCPV